MTKQDIIKILADFDEASQIRMDYENLRNEIADKFLALQPTEREILKRSGHQTQGDFYLGVQWFKNFKR